jgi:hypothetical protein
MHREGYVRVVDVDQWLEFSARWNRTRFQVCVVKWTVHRALAPVASRRGRQNWGAAGAGQARGIFVPRLVRPSCDACVRTDRASLCMHKWSRAPTGLIVANVALAWFWFSFVLMWSLKEKLTAYTLAKLDVDLTNICFWLLSLGYLVRSYDRRVRHLQRPDINAPTRSVLVSMDMRIEIMET